MSTVPNVTTANFPAKLRPGIHRIIGDEYNESKSVVSMVYGKIPSKRKTEVYMESRGHRLASVRQEGGLVAVDESVQGIMPQVTNYSIAKAFSITDETIMWGQYENQAYSDTKSMMKAFNETIDVLGAMILNKANDSSQKMVNGDGQPLASELHPTRGGYYSNKLPIDAPFSQSAVEDMCVLIAKNKDPSGVVFSNIKPTKLLLPVEQMFEAVRILDSTLQSNNANNNINALYNKFGGSDNVIMWNKLTNPNSFYILTDCPIGLIQQVSDSKPTIREQRDEMRLSNYVTVSMMIALAWIDARGAFPSMPI